MHDQEKCEDIITDKPASANLSIISKSLIWLPKSKWDVGSSNIKISGCCVSTLAKNTSCLSPPLRLVYSLSFKSYIPNVFNDFIAIFSSSALGDWVKLRYGALPISTTSKTVNGKDGTCDCGI